MLAESSCSDSSARTDPKKFRNTPKCMVWNQSKSHMAGSFPGTCKRYSTKGEGSTKGSWVKQVWIQSGRLVPTCSKSTSAWPLLHKWQIPTGGFLIVTRFWMLLKLRVKQADLCRKGQSPINPNTMPQCFTPFRSVTPVSHNEPASTATCSMRTFHVSLSWSE